MNNTKQEKQKGLSRLFTMEMPHTYLLIFSILVICALLTYVIPLALFQYYPLLYLIGRSDDIRLLFLPLAGFVFLLPCYAVFRLGLRKYKSTGS